MRHTKSISILDDRTYTDAKGVTHTWTPLENEHADRHRMNSFAYQMTTLRMKVLDHRMGVPLAHFPPRFVRSKTVK
jgi:hypothetical protein